jgi:hypothetical protein
MKAALNNKQRFLNLFTKIVDNHQIDGHEKSNLSLFILKTNANDFVYDEMSRVLATSAIDYALSRKTRVATLNDFGEGELFKQACSLFVPNYGGSGELGEMLLFCFLEADLDAPKILSKLEVKTSTNMHVHGSDGVHFKQLAKENTYQLIFGESKMEKDIKEGISNGFTSIWEFKNEKNKDGKSKSGIGNEKRLINAQLEKEAFTEEELNFIKKLIYPSQSSEEIFVDDAFALFVGFEIQITDDEKSLPNFDFRDQLQKKIEKKVTDQLSYIIEQIKFRELTGHHFYIYFLPFTNIHQTKVKILTEALT